MSKMLPSSRPQISRARTLEILKQNGIDLAVVKLAIIGIRGYYLDTMGAPGKNDRGVYDDCIVVITDKVHFAFNANTDPSSFRARTRSKQGMATLEVGVHWYRRGNHGISRPGGGYPAFRPANPEEKLPVSRDGEPGTSWGIAINIHRGSLSSTSSEGCQTLYPPQWNEFKKLVDGEMTRTGVSRFPYVLVAERR